MRVAFAQRTGLCDALEFEKQMFKIYTNEK